MADPNFKMASNPNFKMVDDEHAWTNLMTLQYLKVLKITHLLKV